MSPREALITFAIATGIEIVAYYLPVVDNLLDAIEIPTAIAIGTAIFAANLGEVEPVLQWTIAAISGGGVAGTVSKLIIRFIKDAEDNV